jgi:hypothetical protein
MGKWKTDIVAPDAANLWLFTDAALVSLVPGPAILLVAMVRVLVR